jgi:uncharacterized membrane protein
LEKAFWINPVPQLDCVLRTGPDALAATDALILNIRENPLFPFFHSIQGTRRTIYFTGRTAHAFLFLDSCSAKEKDNH